MTRVVRTYQVKEVAALTGLSVRALHHYDSIGLLRPSARSGAGYRLYTDDDLLRLQQVMIGRALGLGLEVIRRSLDDPRFDREAALLEQRAALVERQTQTAGMIRAVDRALAMIRGERGGEGDETMDRKELFGGFDPAEHEAEAEARWGSTSAFAESKRRTASYDDEAWRSLQAEASAIYADMAAAMKAGRRPDEPEVMAIAERARLHVDRWFYPCDPEMHAGLAALYEADERFAANIDRFGEGLTPFLAAAIRANARRAGAPRA
ncbi:MAG TPA: MerR family transcriptional regulator [Nannocystaceae bacterium]|nr:MerR family transcriptional regulator [Nannocystaceae bacterium]